MPHFHTPLNMKHTLKPEHCWYLHSLKHPLKKAGKNNLESENIF